MKGSRRSGVLGVLEGRVLPVSGRVLFVHLFARLCLLSLLSPLCLVLATCTSRDAAFREAFTGATAQLEGQELLEALLALDQEHPDRLVLKVNIGALYLARGEPHSAAPYLERGRALASRSRDPHLTYLLYGNLAELALRTERYPESVAYAERALRLQGQDPLGVIFTRAKARLAAGQLEEALADFEAGAESLPRRMNMEDLSAHIQALVRSGDLERALALYRERQRRFGYVRGQGLEESALFEHLGRLDEAVLSAFMELEYRRAAAPLDSGIVRRNLAELPGKLPTGSGGRPGRHTEPLLAALEGYLDGDWKTAAAGLAAVPPGLSHAYLDLLRAAVALELAGAGKAGADGAGAAAAGETAEPWLAAMTRYVELEEPFLDLQSYYHHLWRGMRAAPTAYPAAVVQPVLEKTILLGPGSKQAAESRAELGRLLGLTPDQGRRLLLEPEIRALAAGALARRQPALLEPVLELLSLPDTIYGLQATLALREATADPMLRDYLEARRFASSGRLRERLGALLGP